MSSFTPQSLKAVWVLFSSMASGWADGLVGGEISFLGCISETVRCKMLILGRDISSEV